MAPILSQSRVHETGGNPSSVSKDRSQRNSDAEFVKALYSLSVDDLAIVDYFFASQETKESPRKIA